MNPVETNAPANRVGAAPASPADSQLLHSSLLAMANAQGDGASTGPPALSATPTLAGLVQAIKRRWALALAVAVGLTALAVSAVFVVMPPKYNVTLRLRVVAKQAGPDDIEFSILKANMEALVKSPLVLNAALNDKTADGREIKDLELVRSQGLGAIDWLEKKLKTDYLLGPEVLRVTLPADHAEDAAELLNAIAKAFFNEYAEMERSKKQIRLAELRTKKERIEEDLRTLRGVLAQQQRSLDIKDREQQQVQLNQWLSRLQAAEYSQRNVNEEIAKAESEIFTAKARLKTIDTLVTPEEVLFQAYTRDDVLPEYQKRIAEIDREIAEYARKYNEPFASQYAAPLKREKEKSAVQKNQRETALKPGIEAAYRRRVTAELKNQIELADEKIQSQTRRREQQQKEIIELERHVKNSGPGLQNKPAPIQATEDKIELTKTALNQTAQRISEVELEPLVARVIPLQRASVPLEKDRTQQTKMASAGGLGIFLLALFGVGFYEFRSRKIGLTDEVATGLGLNVIGTIPVMPTRSRKSAVNELNEQKWLGQLQESVDAIRTVILHQARSEALHVLMITSAQSGEGKTTLATQLGASLARAWKRTLIVDADLRHPAVHKLFETPQEPGLAEVLRGEVEPTDAVRAAPVSRLWVLPAGNGDAHAIQALAQDNLRTLFEQLKEQYDFIIIDTPPVLPVADSLLIGQHVDGVVYAILRDVSLAPAIYAAQQKLAPLGMHTLGAVVLGAQAEFNDNNYTYAINQASK